MKNFDSFKKELNSYVKDSDGNPLLVYHGSLDPGLTFKDGSITFFSDSLEVAKEFSDPLYLFGSSVDLLPGEVPTIYMGYIKASNPLILTKHEDYENIMVDLIDASGFINDGYDSLFYIPEDGGVNYYVIFQSSQVVITDVVTR